MTKIYCKWKDCAEEAKVTKLNRFGQPWTNLCEFHSNVYEEVLVENPKNSARIMACTIKALGGGDKTFY